MKKYLGYILFILGIGALVGGTFRDVSEWKQFLVLFFILFGFASILDDDRKELKKEILKEIEEKLN